MTEPIKLPPEFRSGNSIRVERATITRERIVDILTEAIEADRKTTDKQLASYKRLTESLESRIVLLQKQYDELKKTTDPSLLESERAANALLTQEVEALEADRQRNKSLDNEVRSSRSVTQLKEALQDRSQRFTASYSEVMNLIGFYEAGRKHTDDLIERYQEKIRSLEAENYTLISTRGEPVKPHTKFDDPRAQKVYEIICGDNHPPEGEHWDGYVSRLIVDALFPDEPASMLTKSAEAMPSGMIYTVEPHGNGYAIYHGRDNTHHGFNLAHLTECTKEFAKKLESALNVANETVKEKK